MFHADMYPRPFVAAGTRGRIVAVGDGPPVVLLASVLAILRPYRPTVRALARSHRVYAVEMPGSGRAAHLSEPWTLEEYAGWVAAALEVLALRDATVVGHSHAGGVAVVLAALHPERVGRVVIADGIGTCRQSFGRVLFGRAIDTLTAECGLAAREWPALADTIAHGRNAVRQIRVSLDVDLTGYAARVGVPALLAWGSRDHTIPPACADIYARHLPRAELYVSPRGSHCWPITHPDEFAGAVAGFVHRTTVQPAATAAGR